MLHNKDFDAFLRTRKFEEGDKQLAGRIICKTKPTYTHIIRSVNEWVQRYTVFAHPGYAAALCVICGILAGTQLPDINQVSALDSDTDAFLFENSMIIATDSEDSYVN